ncbi:MAG TPA: beta-L-arabinofuranosidase domain-containing protein [Ginsengibacter sp.]
MDKKNINTYVFILSIAFVSFFLETAYSQPRDENSFNKIKPIREKFEALPFASIKPSGWLKEEIEKSLDGFTGHLDSLVPSLIIQDDIYGKDRLTKKVKSKDVGAIADTGEWQVQFLWWNSETQSNWWDGYIRSAILANNKQHLLRIENYIRRILATQDADGYLGIYDKELRYKFNNENGELWAKTTLLRGLLAWYEYTKDKKVLTAIERAVQNVMDNYPESKSRPFYSIKPDDGGLTHGLVFTDVLENLYRITKIEKYRDYCLFLYKDFSTEVLNEDAQYKKLVDPDYKLKGHGVHTYEHLRAVAAAYYASGNQLLGNALNGFLNKIEKTTTVTGGPVGDEWIGGRKADETNTGYEYCSMQELMNSDEDLFLKTGEAKFGDATEKLFFNAAQGSRDPGQSCIAYLKTDNSYYMTGGLNGDTSNKKQTRYSYSPVHQDAAVCCVPNAGRITPYYIQNMWMKDKRGLIASLLGPCEVTTEMDGSKIHILESTSYPYNYSIEFKIEINKPTSFDIKIRKPSWADKFSVSEKWIEENGFIIIHKTWKNKDKVIVQFFPHPEVKKDLNNEYYFTYGALVLAHPIEVTESITRNYPLKGFHDFQYRPVSLVVYKCADDNKPVITIKNKYQLEFTSSMFNPVSQKIETIQLMPMGKTILRQVSFKQGNK